MAEQTKENRWSMWGFCAYFGGVSTLLKLLLVDLFSMHVLAAFALAIFVTSLGAFPLFIRGTEIRWRFGPLRGERWAFIQWLLSCVILTLAATLIIALITGGIR